VADSGLHPDWESAPWSMEVVTTSESKQVTSCTYYLTVKRTTDTVDIGKWSVSSAVGI
jgi:hypothetical protein